MNWWRSNIGPWAMAFAAMAVGCSSSSTSTPQPAPTPTLDGSVAAVPSSDAGLTTDASTPGACASGYQRPSPEIIKAIEGIVGSWGGIDTGNIDNTHSAILIGPPPNAPGPTGANPDWGCIYVDNGGWILMETSQSPGPGWPTCTHEKEQLSVATGIPDQDGFIVGYRRGLRADGTPYPQPKLESAWKPGTILTFDGRHFGSGQLCD